MKDMTDGLLKFTCKYRPCGKDNFLEPSELSENAAKRTRYILYCRYCGRAIQTQREVKSDDQGKWLPCIEYTGTGANLTTGPVPDDKGGFVWGKAGGGNLTEEEFIKAHGINPRIDWCLRRQSENSAHPSYGKACKESGGKINKIKYTTSGPEDVIIIEPDKPPIPPHHGN